MFDSKRTQLLPCVVTDEHRCFCITYAFSFSFQKAKLLRKGFNLAVGVTYPIIMTLFFSWARFSEIWANGFPVTPKSIYLPVRGLH